MQEKLISMKPFIQIDLISKIAHLEELESSTQGTYIEKNNILISHCKQKLRDPTFVNMKITLEELISSKQIARSTSRLYKSALLFAVATEAAKCLDKGQTIEDHRELYNQINNIETHNAARVSDKTSALKLKRFTKELISELEKLRVSDNRFKNLEFVIMFLKANLLVGLRPQEWSDVAIFNYTGSNLISYEAKKNALALCVVNAKTTHGRGNGIERDLIFDNISVEDLGTIIQFSKTIDKAIGTSTGENKREKVKEIFNSAQQTLNRALIKIKYPKNKRPTLYSTRHQCIANAKASNLSDIEIAALFGHRTTETSRIH
jgi:hypothetical protein